MTIPRPALLLSLQRNPMSENGLRFAAYRASYVADGYQDQRGLDGELTALYTRLDPAGMSGTKPWDMREPGRSIGGACGVLGQQWLGHAR